MRIISDHLQLRLIDGGEKMSADLESLSPQEFTLHIKRLNRRGHIAISGKLTKYKNLFEQKAFLHAVEFGFAVDGSSFHQTALEFESLVDGPIAEIL
jgi:hypothetical protein